MHCSANVGADGDVGAVLRPLRHRQDDAVGRPEAPADRRRRARLVSDNGVFNFEDGCYAKVIRLSPDAEPQIYACTRRFGTILENVVFDPRTRRLDLNDDQLTENTRAAYPLDLHRQRAAGEARRAPEERGLPDLRRLGRAAAHRAADPGPGDVPLHLGYTSKIAGTEIGLGIEPEITFSACFGAPFMVHHPYKYAQMLKAKILETARQCWLVNTGWTGGAVRRRQAHQHPPHPRAAECGALGGQAGRGRVTGKTRCSASRCPRACEGVPDSILDPAHTWPEPRGVSAQVRHAGRALHRELQASREAGACSAGDRRRRAETMNWFRAERL